MSERNDTQERTANSAVAPAAAAVPPLTTPAAAAAAAAPVAAASAPPAASTRSPASCTCGCQSVLSSLTARLDASELALARTKEENAVLRAGSAGGGGGSAAALGSGASLTMAFKLMDRIKEERDQLKAENASLKARIALGGGKTPLEQLLEHPDLAPSTRKAVQSLTLKLQDTLAADLLRWNLRAPTDVHGNPFDINRRAMHIAKKLKEAPTPTAGNAGAAVTPHHHHAHHTKQPAAAADPVDAAAAAEGSITDGAALASPPLSRTVTTLQAEEAAQEAPRRKKIVVAKSSMSDEDEDMDRANAAMRAGAAGRGSNQALSSVVSPQSEIDEEDNDVLSPLSDERDRAATAASEAEVASIDTNPLSSSLLSQTNRLIFQEDSPLYRQQLQLQRLRVAQMFSKLDSLSERTSHFAQAALAFSQAAESLSAHLNKGWEDIETNEVIDEAEAVKMDQKRAAAAAAAAAAATVTATPASDDSSPSTAAAASSSSTAASAPSSSKPSASPTGSSPSSSGSSSSLLLPSGPSRIGGSSGGTLTSPLKIPQMQQQQTQQTQQRTLSHSPSPSPPPFLASAAATTTAPQQPAQSSHARQPSVLPTSSSSASSAASSAASASASPRSASRVGSSSEDPLSLGFSMGKLSAIVGCLGTVSNNLGMFVSHLLMTAINSIGRKYRQEAKQSMLLMERLLVEYEEKLGLYLKKKHRDRQRLLNMTNIFGKKKVHDEELMFLAALRRELELRRVEHVEVLNSIQTVRRLELVEVVNASFMSFVTFFHEGDFLAQELRKEVEPLSSQILRRKRFYDAHFKEIADLKAEIKSAALPINLAKIFSSPACLPIGMSAADWVANMTNTASNTMVGGAAATAGAAPSSTAVVTAGSSSPSLGPASSPDHKLVFSNIGHASLIYTIPGIGVAASLTKPAQVQGYLRTQTRDGKSWKRRWHVLEKGTFFYLREAVFLAPKLIVNVLTCGARPVIKHELDFMFELISPTRTILYQAESELEMKTWVACFGNSTEYLLSMQHTRNDTENLERSMDTKSIQREKHLKQGLLSTLRHENPTCAECGTREPDWISINLGVMICIVCSGIHRSLGVHVSKVRSIVLDDLDTELLDMMVALGNERVNAIWEANVPAATAAAEGSNAGAAGGAGTGGVSPPAPCKPHPSSPRESKEEFIIAKYVKRRYLPVAILEAAKSGPPSEECYTDFFRAAAGEDLEVMLTHMLQGCVVDWRHPHDRHRTALHHAARNDAVLACEFLIQNNASTQIEDDDHKTPLDEAKESESKRVCARLQGCAKKAQPTPATH